MKCEILAVKGTWQEVYAAELTTEGKESDKEPSSRWRYRILKAEHSPIRKLIISAKFTDIPYWVVMHLCRHKVGIEHFVKSQRTDRTGIDRNELLQSELVAYEFEANAQAIINISRKRLCRLASPETRQAWQMFITELAKFEPELADCCLPDCDYRGQCYEIKPCTIK
jgi:hypothetical protein